MMDDDVFIFFRYEFCVGVLSIVFVSLFVLSIIEQGYFYDFEKLICSESVYVYFLKNLFNNYLIRSR